MVMKTLLTVSIATADMSVYIGIFVYYTRKLEISLLMASESFRRCLLHICAREGLGRAR